MRSLCSGATRANTRVLRTASTSVSPSSAASAAPVSTGAPALRNAQLGGDGPRRRRVVARDHQHVAGRRAARRRRRSRASGRGGSIIPTTPSQTSACSCSEIERVARNGRQAAIGHAKRAQCLTRQAVDDARRSHSPGLGQRRFRGVRPVPRCSERAERPARPSRTSTWPAIAMRIACARRSSACVRRRTATPARARIAPSARRRVEAGFQRRSLERAFGRIAQNDKSAAALDELRIAREIARGEQPAHLRAKRDSPATACRRPAPRPSGA